MTLHWTRRRYLQGLATSVMAGAVCPLAAAEAAWGQPIHVATNTYPWSTFAGRSGTPLPVHSDALLEQIAGTGIQGYEPIIQDPAEFSGLGDRLAQRGLKMTSIYVNSTLHDPGQAEPSCERVLAIARAAKPLGVRMLVTNPSPIRWGGPEDKDDQQLRFQARTLDRLGARVRELGLILAYHNHDAELRQGAREFHHMLTATDPEHVKLCFDAHWVYRGCGDSEVAVFDALQHYHPRIVELHLRQSRRGVWNEVFEAEGDIDYVRMFTFLSDHNNLPHLVLEQAVEAKSDQQHNAAEAHRQGLQNLMRSLT